MVSIFIKHGWFHQIVGKSAQNGGFVFIPVLGDLGGELEIIPYKRVEEDPMFPLSDYIEGQPPTILENWLDRFGDSVDAMWVKARIIGIFGNILISLPVPDYKYGLIEQTFMACERGTDGDWVAYPFICEDYNLCAGLRFHSDNSLTEIYQRIARAFWELLLAEPECVCAFRACYLHYDEMDIEEWRSVVFKRGRFSVEEIDINVAFW